MGCWAPIFWYFFVAKNEHKPGKRGCMATVWLKEIALTGNGYPPPGRGFVAKKVHKQSVFKKFLVECNSAKQCGLN